MSDSLILIDNEIAFVQIFSNTQSDVWSIIDSEDIILINNKHWCLNYNGYPGLGNGVFLHRIIMNTLNMKGNMVVDHINQDKLNNRKQNLRIITKGQNGYNAKIRKTNKSGYKGVCWYPSRNKWRAYISIEGKQKTLGYFDKIEDAINIRIINERRLLQNEN